MSFKSGKTVIGQISKESVDPYKGLPSFSEDEFSYLFYKLENMEFKGKEMEQIYSLTLKLQNLYLFYQKQNLLK
jgi:hypothetical protein|tara:strand:- start:95 stop:316 length:222 start_codon:yes stop_codon:yes gene_type:complete